MKFQIVMYFIPLVSMLLAWFTGYLRLSLVLLLLVVLEVVGLVLTFLALPIGMNDPGLAMSMFLGGIAVMVFGPWLAVLTGFALSPRRTPAPIHHVASAAASGAKTAKATWDGLDPAMKEQIVEGAKKATRFGLKVGAKALQKKGLFTAAAFVAGARHFF